jgi:SAM-dependent methyltransferase
MAGEQSAERSGASEVDWWQQFEQLMWLHLPDLTGKTVLDVGAGAGYFSFAAERFGAARVVAAEGSAWRRGAGRAAFERTRAALASKVEDLEVDVLDICPRTVGQFDVVLALGVLPQVSRPSLALERMASVTRELLVLETLVDMAFVPSSVARCASWDPREDAGRGPANRATIVSMLHGAGFEKVVSYPVKRLSVPRLVGLPARMSRALERSRGAPWGARRRQARGIARGVLLQSRLVAHARR